MNGKDSSNSETRKTSMSLLNIYKLDMQTRQ